MKVGIRKPSIKKSISAKTTGKVTRTLKKSVNPMYGKKGVGIIKDPKKAMYNKVYNKTTVSFDNVLKTPKPRSSFNGTGASSYTTVSYSNNEKKNTLNIEHSDEENIVAKINKLKTKRRWFNIIGCLGFIPMYIDAEGFVGQVLYAPVILPVLISLSPFIFLIYKASKIKAEILSLKNELKAYNYNEENIVIEINRSKSKRVLFNIVGYFITILLSISMITNGKINNPVIFTSLIIRISPFILLIHKARKLKLHISLLENDLQMYKEKVKEEYNADNVYLHDDDNELEESYLYDLEKALEVEQPGDVIYRIENKEELIVRIQKSNDEILNTIKDMIISFQTFEFVTFDINRGILIRNLRDIIMSCNALKNHIDDNLVLIDIDSIISTVNSFKFRLELLANEISLIKLNLEFGAVSYTHLTLPTILLV